MLESINRFMADSVPHNRELGLSEVELGAEKATMRLPYAEKLVGACCTAAFLRSGQPQALAKATMTRLGRRVANLQVQAWQEDHSHPIASAKALFLLS